MHHILSLFARPPAVLRPAQLRWQLCSLVAVSDPENARAYSLSLRWRPGSLEVQRCAVSRHSIPLALPPFTAAPRPSTFIVRYGASEEGRCRPRYGQPLLPTQPALVLRYRSILPHASGCRSLDWPAKKLQGAPRHQRRPRPRGHHLRLQPILAGGFFPERGME